MRKILLPVFSLILLAACTNLEDADLSERKTFVKFFNGPHNFSAASLELTPNGYTILGTMEVNDTLTISALIETDENGNRIGEIHYFRNQEDGFLGKAFKPIINGNTIEGYIIVGDSIKINPFEEQAANIIRASLKLVHVTPNFTVDDRFTRADRRDLGPSQVSVDFYGHTLTLTDDGRIFVLGGVKEGVVGQQAAPELTQLIEFSAALDSVWSIEYDINDKTYQNSKSLIYKDGYVVWSSAIAIEQGGFNQSYVTIPVAEEESIFVNFSQVGQTSSQLFVPGDISIASNQAFGYGVTGTFSSETNGSLGNVFFLRANQNGDILPGSLRYFDGLSGIAPLADPTDSDVVDEGETITCTSDGGFIIAGTTTLTSGSGKDLWLIKINGIGDAVWSKTFGGSGDQVPSKIKELPSGEILVCGTNTVGGFSSIFLIKTDANGEVNQ
jgi:hypothetical protein